MHDPIAGNIFGQTALLLLAAAVFGAIALRLRQPLVVAFVAVGILAGPSVLGWTTSDKSIQLLAELGLSLLLFVVGLKLDVGLIRSMGLVSLATGIGQVALTGVIAFLIALGLGLGTVSALYTGIALSFSSTIIVVKMLSDKRETDSLHGRIAIGLLIVQDILVVLAMVVLSGLGQEGSGGIGLRILQIALRGVALFAALAVFMYFILPRVIGFVARTPELLVLSAIAWAIALASLASAMGFSKEVGAFLAGVTLASTEYREVLAARLVSLRDFLLLFFFVDLGIRLDLGTLGSQVWAAMLLSAFVLIGKPLIMLAILGAMGYRRRTGFLSGLYIAQISEFSLILAALGLLLGHIGEDIVGLITLVGLVTIAVSAYLITASEALYDRLAPYLKVFERKALSRERLAYSEGHLPEKAEVIMFGLGRYGSSIARHLSHQGRPVLGVDFDPQAVANWNNSGRPAVFGDAEDPEFPAALPLSSARWVVSSIRDRDINVSLMHSLRSHGFTGSIAVTAQTEGEAGDLRPSADVVFVPFSDAASQAADILSSVDAEERRKQMDREIEAVADHFIICGYGRMGQQIVQDLSREGLPCVVVEWNPEQLPKLIRENVPHVVGKATEDAVLQAAGIARARCLVSVTATDEENVFIVLTARGLSRHLYIVARSIRHDNEDKLRRAGADRVISPYILGGHRMALAAMRPRVIEFLEVVEHGEVPDVDLFNLVVGGASTLVGKSIRESGLRAQTGALVLAVRRWGGELFANPEPDMTIEEGDELIVMGTRPQIDAAERLTTG